MYNKIDTTKPVFDSITGWLDTSPDINELALLDPVTAEIESANGHRAGRNIKIA